MTTHQTPSATHRPLTLCTVASLGAASLLLLAAPESQAIPYYARSTGMSCLDCHSVTPKLNARGESFLARGYRLPGDETREKVSAVPMSVWITGRHQERPVSDGPDVNRTYVPKVELISGGPISTLPFSYFIEWRVVSLDLQNDDTLQDRGGRFEDAFIDWQAHERVTFRAGQYRALNQYDVSLRLSVSEPTIFSTGLPGDPTGDARIQSLRSFSPSGRSPGFSVEYQSLEGTGASDGLFHWLTVPFVGELSLPLSEEARDRASFELHGPPKGVFLETFYRKGLNSIGAHAFVGDGRWLVTGVGRTHYKDFYATAGVGLDDTRQRSSRGRYSLELEYLPVWRDLIRPGVGFRVEHISKAGREPAYIPYFVMAGPNTNFNFVLQLEARFEGANKGVFLDLSSLF